MKPICLLILASLVVCNLTACGGQSISDEDETNRMTIDDIILQRAKSLLLRSLLQKMQEDDMRDERSTSQAEWVTKRQHPGKRYGENLEKRQHPGRREEDEDEQLRFHFQKRQHPGKRTAAGDSSETPAIMYQSELSKRQHPGKRYVVLHSKRQHPGRRLIADEEDDYGDWNADADADEDENVAPVQEKRQHPGKRFWHNSSPDSGTDSPCEPLNPASCSKTSLLLDFLDSINKSHTEEKRQHPGKRFAPGEDLVEGK